MSPISPSPILFPELFRDEVLHLESRRLWLRWPTLADSPRLHEIASLEEVARPTASWPHPLPKGEAERRIAAARAGNADGSTLLLALAGKSRPRQLIGLVGAAPVEGHAANRNTLVVGYLLDVEHQGAGLMTEAVRTLVAAIFRFSAFDRMRGASGVTNHASRRVLEKAGFRLVGQRLHPAPARSAPVACDELELIRSDWRARPCLRTASTGRDACAHAA